MKISSAPDEKASQMWEREIKYILQFLQGNKHINFIANNFPNKKQ